MNASTTDVQQEADVDRFDPGLRSWTTAAVGRIRAELNRSSDTHLISVPLPEDWGIDLYLKDESTHPTGSLKHRLARSLFLHALCNGWLRPGCPVVEASSGSTAVSEAYFARLIGVPFIAVMVRGTSQHKIDLIELHGGTCHYVDRPEDLYETARALAYKSDGHYMDQFTFAERATDWRGNNNIAESLFEQMRSERHPEPEWIVTTAGTGGTSATIGRYIRYTGRETRVCLADPDNSAFFRGWRDNTDAVIAGCGSRIEGIGRPRLEPSFIGSVVDRMMHVPDGASVAAIHHLESILGRKAGASTGTGLWAAYQIVSEMVKQGETGSVVALLCDDGNRYLDKYYSASWLAAQGIDPDPYRARIHEFVRTGHLPAAG